MHEVPTANSRFTKDISMVTRFISFASDYIALRGASGFTVWTGCNHHSAGIFGSLSCGFASICFVISARQRVWLS